MVLVSQRQWLARVMGLFGNGWRVFMVFVLMAVRNLRSIEQLKHARREEAGRLLGLGSLPCLDTLWGWSARRCGSPTGTCYLLISKNLQPGSRPEPPAGAP